MSSIRRHAWVLTAVVLAAGIGLGITLTPSAAAPKPAPGPSASAFLHRWQVNSAVLSAAGQYPPTLDLTTGGLVTLTCTPQTCANPGTVENPGTVDWQLGGGIAIPSGKELVIDSVSFYYVGSGVMQGAGTRSGPGGPAGGLMWLTVAVPDQSGQLNPGWGADILLPLQAVNLPNNQVTVTGSEHGSWIVLPSDHILLAGIIMGNLGSLMDATPPVVGFLSVFGHYATLG